MYITTLENFTDQDWKNLLKDFRARDRIKIKQILTLPTKEAIVSNFDYLWEVGIINGIGANYMGKICIAIITFFFPGVRFEFHDIAYFIGGSKKDRENADFGLFKYSVLSIVENYKKINSLEILFILKEFFIVFYTVFAIMKLLVLIIFWRILIYFGGKAFNF